MCPFGEIGKLLNTSISQISLFLEKVILNYGIDKVFELADKVEHPHIYGNVLAMMLEISLEDSFKIVCLQTKVDFS